MINKIKDMLFYLLIIVIAFYGSLLLLNYDISLEVFLLLFAIPIICLATSITYGIINKFNILFSILVLILFVPFVFSYNINSWIYLVIYPVLTLIGNVMGLLIRRIIGK